jgi:hypothetical protein
MIRKHIAFLVVPALGLGLALATSVSSAQEDKGPKDSKDDKDGAPSMVRPPADSTPDPAFRTITFSVEADDPAPTRERCLALATEKGALYVDREEYLHDMRDNLCKSEPKFLRGSCDAKNVATVIFQCESAAPGSPPPVKRGRTLPRLKPPPAGPTSGGPTFREVEFSVTADEPAPTRERCAFLASAKGAMYVDRDELEEDRKNLCRGPVSYVRGSCDAKNVATVILKCDTSSPPGLQLRLRKPIKK